MRNLRYETGVVRDITASCKNVGARCGATAGTTHNIQHPKHNTHHQNLEVNPFNPLCTSVDYSGASMPNVYQ